MRYPHDHREKIRRRIIDAASKRFREDGIADTGVAALMAEAGLTQGAFYTHFDSKADLVAQAMGAAFAGGRRGLANRAARAREDGNEGLTAIVDTYLSAISLDDPGRGCAFAANGQELSRQSDAIRRTTFAGASEIIDLISLELDEAHRSRAAAILCLMAGTLQLARLAGTSDERQGLLAEGREAVFALAGCNAG
jgi:TetR/AcrR family transcriptional repressor of nem operon